MKKIINFLEYAFVILLILDCRSVYLESTSIDLPITELLLGVLGILIVFKIITTPFVRGILQKNLIYIFVYEIYISIFFVLNNMGDKGSSFIVHFMGFVPMFFLYFSLFTNPNEKIKSYLLKQSKIIIFLSGISVVLYFVGPVLNILPATGSIKVLWGEEKDLPSYFGLLFVTQHVFFLRKYTFIRNTSIFTEAPMFSLHLIIALAIYLGFCKKIKKSNVIIIILGLITSFSTTGMVIAMILFYLKYSKGAVKKHRSKLKYILIPVAIIVAFTLISSRKQSNSFVVRTEDYQAGFRAFCDKPLFGSGYANFSRFSNYMDGSREMYGTSNSIVSILGQCGIYLSLFYYIGFILLWKKSKINKDKSFSLFLTIIFILFLTTSFAYTTMLLYFLAIMYSYKKNEDIEILENELENEFKMISFENNNMEGEVIGKNISCSSGI